jgi:hypothetical protein
MPWPPAPAGAADTPAAAAPQPNPAPAAAPVLRHQQRGTIASELRGAQPAQQALLHRRRHDRQQRHGAKRQHIGGGEPAEGQGGAGAGWRGTRAEGLQGCRVHPEQAAGEDAARQKMHHAKTLPLCVQRGAACGAAAGGQAHSPAAHHTPWSHFRWPSSCASTAWGKRKVAGKCKRVGWAGTRPPGCEVATQSTTEHASGLLLAAGAGQPLACTSAGVSSSSREVCTTCAAGGEQCVP